MRSRRSAARAVVEEELSPEDTGEEAPSEEAVAPAEAGALRICLECGGEGTEAGDCPHREVAVFHAPDRAARQAVTRMHAAVNALRVARRSLGTAVQTAISRERAELETRELKPPTPPAPVVVAMPCPRCDAEAPPAEAPARRRAGRRGSVPVGQFLLPFASRGTSVEPQPTDAKRDQETSSR